MVVLESLLLKLQLTVLGTKERKVLVVDSAESVDCTVFIL